MGKLLYTNESIFSLDVQTIVNTVNCRGIMNAGLALEFKKRFPKMFQQYVELCERGEMSIGRPYLYKTNEHQWIVNFPTKNDWRKPSKMEWIESGLQYFAQNYKSWEISSIAFPQLGCRNGNLKWEQVEPIMVKHLSSLAVPVWIYVHENH
jgi:O-acetyl-ADP-ribose deacetylase (regulator of RNase III)